MQCCINKPACVSGRETAALQCLFGRSAGAFCRRKRRFFCFLFFLLAVTSSVYALGKCGCVVAAVLPSGGVFRASETSLLSPAPVSSFCLGETCSCGVLPLGCPEERSRPSFLRGSDNSRSFNCGTDDVCAVLTFGFSLPIV